MSKLLKTAIASALMTLPLSIQVVPADPVIPPPTDYNNDFYRSKALPPVGPTIEPRRDPFVQPGCGMNCPSPVDNHPAADLPERLPTPLPPPWVK